MNDRKSKTSNKQIPKPDSDQINDEKNLIPANDFQKFFKLEFESLNYFVDQEMSKLKEEFESELLKSKSLLNKYRNLRQLCDKKKEFDQFKRWNDYHNSHHYSDHEPIDSHRHQQSRGSSIRQSSHSRYYYDDYPRSRKAPTEYDERRYFNSRMVRDIPSSQRKGISKRSYQDDLRRVENMKSQSSHRSRSPSNH